MKRLQIYFEELQLPIKVLFVGTVLIALGSLIGNPFIDEIFKINSPMLDATKNILLLSGGLILSYFPVFVFVKLLQTRTDDKNIVLVGLISIFFFTIFLLFLGPRNLPDNAYSTLIKVTLNNRTYRLVKTGIIGYVVVYLMIKRVYRKPMSVRYMSSISIIDSDLIRMIKSIIYSTILGSLVALASPYIMNAIYGAMKFIALDVGNPMSLFAFGSFDRLLNVFGLETIMRSEMWLGTLGGTWNSLDNTAYIGDVNIWSAQINASLAVLGLGSAGRFSTAFYVINIFAIPGYLAALATTTSDKKRFRRSMVGTMLGILLSVLSGIAVPVEFIMLLTTPVIYIFHIFMVGFISAVLLGLGVTIGFSYQGIIEAANPGNLIDLIAFSRHQIIGRQIIMMLLFGTIIFFAYFLFTRFYYTKIAIDILNLGVKDDETIDFIERVGGLDNIINISSTPTRIILSLYDEDNINVGGLHRQGVTRIVQTRQGYVLSFGAGSYMLQREVNKRLSNHKSELVKEDNHD